MSDTEETITARADSLVQDHEQLLRALITHRKNHHLSQDVVAERMGVTQPTVASFERYDANPTLSTIRRYAIAVGARIHTEVRDDCIVHTTEPVEPRTTTRNRFIHFVADQHLDHRDTWIRTSSLETAGLIGRGR